MLQVLVGLVLVGLVLAYGLRWLWRPATPVKRLSPKGKTFVVTGAASGFGKEVTRLLAEQGGYVFALDLNHELLDQEWRDNPNVQSMRCDVTDLESINAAVEKIRESGRGGVFGLFNNAGIAHPLVSLVDCPDSVMMQTIAVNCIGLYRVTKALFPLIKEENERLKAAGEGTCAIVNMTSMAGLVASPLMGPYTISKHAAEAFNTTLRRELRAFGIRVSSVQPFFARTPLLVAAEKTLDSSEEHWRELSKAQITVLEHTDLLDPVLIAQSVLDALLCEPAPLHTIVAPYWEYFVGKYLIYIMPHKMQDFVLTEGIISKAKELRTKQPSATQQKKDD